MTERHPVGVINLDVGQRRGVVVNRGNAEESGEAIEVMLGIGAQFVVEENHDIGGAEIVLPGAKVIGVTAGGNNLAMSKSGFGKGRLDQAALLPMLVVRPGAFNRIAESADNFTVGNMQFEALTGFGRIEVSWRDFHQRKIGRAIAEMRLVPVGAETVVPDEELSFLDALGQADAAVKHL